MQSPITQSTGDKIEAAKELLSTTKRTLQLVDEHIARLQSGRVAVALPEDVSTEHRASWLGAVDDLDQNVGIRIGALNAQSSFGWQNPKAGIIRNQEDAAFVVTDIMTAVAYVFSLGAMRFIEGQSVFPFVPAQGGSGEFLLRLTDGNTGRNLIAGLTTGPNDLERGAVPFEYLSSIRPGLGSNIKNRLFSEFTIPRAGTVKLDVFNLGRISEVNDSVIRVFVALFGYKVYGA